MEFLVKILKKRSFVFTHILVHCREIFFGYFFQKITLFIWEKTLKNIYN